MGIDGLDLVELANTIEKRSLGLSGRKNSRKSGYVFVLMVGFILSG